MHTNPSADAYDEGSTGSHGLPQPAGERLQELCQGLLVLLGGDMPRQSADPASPHHQLQTQAGRILRPHLEAGLRELTEVLRQDLLVRVAYVQQLERLTERENDPSSLSRMLQGQARILSAAVIPESPPLAASPLPSPEPAEHAFDWESAPLQAEQPLSLGTTPAASSLAAPSPSSEPASLEDDLRQAAELWRQGDEDQAVALCSQAIQHDPAAVGAYLLRGQMHAQRREDEQAIADFTSAIALCPHHVKAYLRRSNLLLELGKLDQARQGYSIALAFQPDLAEAYLKRGLIHLRQKKWPEAVADAGAVIRLQPDCGSAYFIRASASFQHGDWQRALSDLNRLLQREPNNVLAYNERGLVLASRGEYAQALADYARALRLKPRFVPARYNRALALLQQGELDLALAAFTDLIQLSPDNAMAYYQRARVHQARQELEQALADCRHSLKLEPHLQEAEVCLRELQSVVAPRRERPSPPTLAFAPEATAKKEATSHPKKPADHEKPAEEPTVASKDENLPSRRPASVPGCITLTCEECGATAQVGIDRLHRKFQCRQCGRIYTVRPDGRLTEIVRPRTPQEQFKASIRKAVRLLPVAALLLAAIVGGWLGWRGFVSARSPQPLPKELEPRAEILVKAWLNRDVERMQLLTTPAQEDRIDSWLRTHSFPMTAEELKASRTWIHQTTIEVRVLREERDRVQLGIKVHSPVSPSINLEQMWVRIGPTWYFQPYPEQGRKSWQSASKNTYSEHAAPASAACLRCVLVRIHSTHDS